MSQGTPVDLAATSHAALFERSPDAVQIIEQERFVDCNQATVLLLRASSKDDVLSAHPSELSPVHQPDGRGSLEKATEMMALAQQRGSHRFEWEHTRMDGEPLSVDVLLTTVPGQPGRMYAVWQDITERKVLEAQLRQALKLEAVGKLAGGAAHDFSNLLVVILGNAELLASTLPAGHPNLELVDEISHAAGRAGELTSQLLTYSRRQVMKPDLVDLNRVVERLKHMLGRLSGEHIELVANLSAESVRSRVDPGQFEQVLVNLITNASDAMPDGGSVTIETSVVELDDLVVGMEGRLRPGRYARLVVSDTGSGMDEDTRLQAFDPFFTTKVEGKGTGLGLSTVYGIVKQSGGEVTLNSELGYGTSIVVLLPLVEQGVVGGERLPPVEVEVRGGDETILLVEDDPAVTHLLARVLRKWGYSVLVARGGREAFEMFEERAPDVDLVLSDVVMSVVSGPKLLEDLAVAGHRPPFLFLSGFPKDALAKMEAFDLRMGYLQKPFRTNELLLRVRELLDALGEGPAPGSESAD